MVEKQKLGYATSTLNRLRDSLPAFTYRELYYTLFESHLTYCISVWGGASQQNIEKLWKCQKLCIRSIFGDHKAYHDKFKTSCRTRSLGQQQLGQEFFTLEHTKPIFKEQKILSVQNLYTYHCFMECFKILKLRCPMSLFSDFTLSKRRPTNIITAFPSRTFTSRSSSIWNILAPKLKLYDYSENISIVKTKLKNSIFVTQHSENELTWTPGDYNIQSITIIDS